jgi:3-dehydroquinate dehydratase-1
VGDVRTIYLIGFSGTGKSAVARLLGARLGLPVRDLDDAIVARTGRPIADIFANDGEVPFRELESAALRDAANEGGVVVATGGGVPTIAANRDLMFATGWVITLEALPETLHARLRAQLRSDGQAGVRPLLDNPDPLARIRSLKETRQPVYARAHWTVHTDRLNAAQVAEEIARAVVLLEQSSGAAAATVDPDRGFRVGTKWFGRDRPVVCVPIVAATLDEACAVAGQIAPLAPDAVELRADYLADTSPEAIAALLARLATYDLPILFTNRVASEGGARAQDEEARIAALVAAIESGVPALVDVELATPSAQRDRVLAAGKRRGVPVLLSFHHFGETPPDEELLAHVAAMQAAGADAAKLAVMPRAAGDVTRLLTLCRAIAGGAAGDIAIPLAAMSMGALGMITRVLGHRAGSALTFAALTPGGGSAPGQLSVEELRACWAATAEV